MWTRWIRIRIRIIGNFEEIFACLTSEVVLRKALQLASMVPAFFFISSKKRKAAFSSSSA
jgi:hypothetical protein